METVEVPAQRHPLGARLQSWRWQRKLLAMLWRKRHFGAAPTADSLVSGRNDFEGVGQLMGEPAGAVIRDDDADGVPVQWLDFRDGGDGPVLFYVHGGAFAMGSIVASRHAASTHARRAGALCLVVDYRLAPEHPWPAGLDDVETAWHWLCRLHDPTKVVVIGESAGGGLAVNLLARLRDGGAPLPAAAVTISAWADLGLTGPSYRQRRRRDLALDTRLLELAAAAYLGTDGQAADPDVSGVQADLTGFPPLLLAVGTEEVVWDDTMTLAAKARAAGVPVTTLVGTGQIHCWPGYQEHLLAAAEACDHIRAFVLHHTATSRA